MKTDIERKVEARHAKIKRVPLEVTDYGRYVVKQFDTGFELFDMISGKTLIKYNY